MISDLRLAGKVCVEIGVLLGEFSEVILAQKPLLLYLIDPWIEQDKRVYFDRNNVSQPRQNARYNHVIARFGRIPNIEIIRDFSVQAAKKFKDESIDFIYLDGNHSRKAVKQDLAAWYPKVKRGGWFCGHDYINVYGRRDTIEVKMTVDRFLHASGNRLQAVTSNDLIPSWGFRKLSTRSRPVTYI